MVIDLGRKTTGPALEILRHSSRRLKVKSAFLVRQSGACMQYEARSGEDKYDLMNFSKL
jgi:hypothetical protein